LRRYDEGDGTYTAAYTVDKTGLYKLDVDRGGERIAVPPGASNWPIQIWAYSGATSAAYSILDTVRPGRYQISSAASFNACLNPRVLM